MISPNSVQEIIDTSKVEDVVGEFVNLKRRGVNMIGLCPFHNEKTPSFTVSPTKNIYKCFGCGKAGNSVQFLMDHEQLSFPEALRYLAKKYGIEIEETQRSPEQKEKQQYQDSLYIINEYAKTFFQEQLFETDTGKSVGLNYFKERGFREETIKKFGLGFAPDKKDAFTLEAVNKGYKSDLLKKLGLTTQYGGDFFRNRVMFSIHNLSGKTIGFGGRILLKDVKAPKYINSPETEIYNKSRVLYGAYYAKRGIRQQDECIMVEGYTDVISLHQAGIDNVVASSGTSLTVDQILLVKRYSQNIKILYDGDAAGVKAALRGLDLVLEQDMNVRVVLLPEGEDPDSYLQSVGTTAFKEYIDKNAKDFILFKVQLLLEEAQGDPIKKSNLIQDIVSSIARIPDPIKRSLYVKECANVMEVEEDLLVNETNKAFTKNLEKKRQERANQLRREARQRHQAQQGTPGEEAPFPTAEPAYIETESQAGEMLEAGQIAPPSDQNKRELGIEFQEKDIVRILISSGSKIINKENGTTVAVHILENLEEVLDDFENKTYEKIVKEVVELVAAKREITTQHFTNHRDQQIQSVSIDVLHSPHEYSPNWEAKYDMPLRNQPMPELNVTLDSTQALQRFKLKKVVKMCEENQQRIQVAMDEKNDGEILKLMKVQTHLLSMRNELATELKTVIIK